MNVLIVPGTNGCAAEIVRSLTTMKNISIFGAGSDLGKAGEFPYKKYHFLPDISNSSGALNALRQLILSSDIKFDFVFLAHDQWIYESRAVTDISGTKIIRHNSRAIEIASYKSKTYETFEKLIRVPRRYGKHETIRAFPIFAKPDRGQGSRGAKKIETVADYQDHLSDNHSEEYIYTEFLNGPEYTIDCFSSTDGNLVFARPRIRNVISNGVAVGTSTIENPLFDDIAKIISEELKLSGAWFYQMKEGSDGLLYLLEIGLRPGGASGIQRLLGINQSAAWLYQVSGHKITSIYTDWAVSVIHGDEGSQFKFDRKINSIYVDFDDTICVNETLNVPLLSYLQDARTRGTNLTLISRHKGDLLLRLAELNIDKIFDEVVQIDSTVPKANFMKSELQNVLFIDDSFVEREEVSRLAGPNVLVLDQTFPSGYSYLGDAN